MQLTIEDNSAEMEPSGFDSATWYRALTLAERSASPSATSVPSPHEPALPTHDELGLRRLRRWRSQPPFDDDAFFTRRLAANNLDEARLLLLLSEPPEHLRARIAETPDWLVGLAEAFSRPASAFSNPLPGDHMLAFLDLIQPIIDRACMRLAAGVAVLAETWPTLPFDPETIEEILLMNLPEPLLMRLSRTLVLELNIARLQEQLEGDTPEARFQSFVLRLRQPEVAIALLADYPVLARRLLLFLNRWVDVNLEFLQRLCADWTLIRGRFSPEQDPGLLVDLAAGAGDTHRGGRSVMVAAFENYLQIVYKPKSLAVDAHFQELLAWLNGRGCTPQLRTLQLLDRGDYGWVEYVHYGSCYAAAELESFYQRHGAYLALLYALRANDFHFENLIASGEHPVLIDLETLFQPEFEHFDGAQAVRAVEKVLAESVLQVGLLPMRLWADDEYAGIDISGLGGAAGQLSPERALQPAFTGTDTMRYERVRLELPGEANRPTLNGDDVSAADYVDHVAVGFTAMYRLLQQHRNDLLAHNGPLDRFAHDEIRLLLRPTRTYGQLLEEGFHPDLLHDGLEQDLFLDRLWIAARTRAYLQHVIAAEQSELHQGDIPLFTTTPSSLELCSGAGQTISGVLTAAGISQVRSRLASLDEQDMERQLWFIRASMTTLAGSVGSSPEASRGFPRPRPYDPGPTRPGYPLRKAGASVSRERLLAEADRVARRLAAVAVEGDEDVSWYGMASLLRIDLNDAAADDDNWIIAPLGIDLYGGLPGIALFLAYAGAVLEEESYTSLARRAVQATRRQIETLRNTMPEIGAFEGWGGVLYALTHLATLWKDQTLLKQAEEIVEIMAGLAVQDQSFDVMRGAAGAIGSLLAYHHSLCASADAAQGAPGRLPTEMRLFVPSSQALAVAEMCGDHLLASAQRLEQGLGWLSPHSGKQPSIGFAHGAGGIAWALLKLSAATGKERFQVAAQQAMVYERSRMSSAARNGRSKQRPYQEAAGETTPQTLHYGTAWCRGAAGIGLARLVALDHLDTAPLLDEVRDALQATLDHGFGPSHSLCHGDMGTLELLLEASVRLGDAAWRIEAEGWAAAMLESVARDGWQCGGPAGVELPGLMLGLAGMGYTMLRLAASAGAAQGLPEGSRGGAPTKIRQLPSILLLEPP